MTPEFLLYFFDGVVLFVFGVLIGAVIFAIVAGHKQALSADSEQTIFEALDDDARHEKL